MPPGGWAPARPKPGIVPLRPLSLGEIYDGAFQAIRTNPRAMMGVSALVLTAVVVVSTGPQAALLHRFGARTAQLGTGNDDPTAADFLGIIGDALGSFALPQFLQFVALAILNALLVVAVSGAVLGRKMSPGLLWSQVRHRFFAVLGLAVVVSVGIGAVIVVPLAPGVAVLATGHTALGIALLLLGLLVAVVAAVLLTVGWSLSGPALLLEKLGVVAALGRSFRLVRGSFWRILGIEVLTQILLGVGSGLVSVPFAVGGTLVGLGQDVPYDSFVRTLLQLMVTGVGSIVAGAVFYPFAAAVTALLYVDLRMRREGLDVELMRAAEESPSA